MKLSKAIEKLENYLENIGKYKILDIKNIEEEYKIYFSISDKDGYSYVRYFYIKDNMVLNELGDVLINIK